ncbi:MAG: Lrp/AsnC family transcriptional regulator [Candidatus Bathyarchaeota archaeon]|nr:Lrp/AsnC family transcriptional regulator [Candidatus Bathyarchaeota archaeon]
MELDGTDVKILRILLSDARLSSRQIARKTGVSIGTVLSRIKKMKQTGIIKEYSAIVDHEKLGYELTVITEMTISKGRLSEIAKEIARVPNVCCVYNVTGLTDAMVIAKFKKREELSGFTKYLLSLPYVERTNTHVVLTTMKEDFRVI